VKAGGEYFTQPTSASQRRYEALRAYLYDDEPAEQVAERFGYTAASVRQLASELRAGRLELFVEGKPGPKGPRKQPVVRQRVLELRARDLSVTAIADILTDEGTPVSHDTVWQVLKGEGLERLAVRSAGRPPPPAPAARAPTVKVKTLEQWPAGMRIVSEHAGLLLLLPALVELGYQPAVKQAAYPSTRALSSWHSMASLLLCKLARHRRIHHVEDLVADPAVGLAVGLNTLPKTTHLSGYSHRVERTSRARAGHRPGRVDFRHPPPRPRSAELRAQPNRPPASAFVAQCLRQRGRAQGPQGPRGARLRRTGKHTQVPSPLVFDSQLTTYHVDELSARGVTCSPCDARRTDPHCPPPPGPGCASGPGATATPT
jgi:transposase